MGAIHRALGNGATYAMTQPDESAIRALEADIGHTFADRDLVRLALTHRSTASEAPGRRGKGRTAGALPPTNERLEFLGDAILAYVSADYLYRTYPHLTEGELTAARAALVKAPTLADFARQLGLGQLLILGKGEDMTGGRTREPLLAAGFEALLGALALDGGFAVASAFVLRWLVPAAEPIVAERRFKDDKTIFQEVVQARLAQTPLYQIVAAEGPSHQRTYTVEVRIGDLVAGRGTGTSKQRAELAAARDALAHGGWQPETPDDTPEDAGS
jgi:ribonuclease-3